MNTRLLSVVLAASALLFGCATPEIIKEVQDRPVENLKASENSKPIQFTKIVVKLKRGDHIGALEGGVFCVANSDLTWKGGRV